MKSLVRGYPQTIQRIFDPPPPLLTSLCSIVDIWEIPCLFLACQRSLWMPLITNKVTLILSRNLTLCHTFMRLSYVYVCIRLSSNKTFVSKLSLRKLNYGLVSSPAFINGCIDGDGKGRETVTIQWKAGHSKLDGGNDFERHFTEQMTEEKSRAAVAAAAAENQEDISARGTPIILSLDPLSWCLANACNHICLEDRMNPQKSPIKTRIVGVFQ